MKRKRAYPRSVLDALVFALAILLISPEGAGQEFGGGSQRRRGTEYYRNTPEWELDPKFENDCFTFVRIMYRSTANRSSSAWWTDYPDADNNLSWRLHQLTAMKVAPIPKKFEIMDDELLKYPFAFMSGVPRIVVSDEEVDRLRKYMLVKALQYYL